jgi:hypothetical protein
MDSIQINEYVVTKGTIIKYMPNTIWRNSCVGEYTVTKIDRTPNGVIRIWDDEGYINKVTLEQCVNLKNITLPFAKKLLMKKNLLKHTI